MTLIDDVAVVLVGTVGLNGESADAVRMTSIEAAHEDISDRLDTLTTADLTNIDETGAAAGQALIRNAANDGYDLGDPSGAIADVDGTADVDTLTTGDGLTSSSPSAGAVELAVVWGSTGALASVAHSDHTHRNPTPARVPYSASGTLSSGSRTLQTTNVTLAGATGGEAAITWVVDAYLYTCQRGNGGSSYYTLSLTIDGTTTTSAVPLQCVGGVPDRPTHYATKTITGDGTAKTITGSIAYSSGGPLTVDAGVLVLILRANK